ncbi:MAG: Acetyltransferase family protein [Candidatus Nomurabacteria bacterium]|nr:Acetyltransferase family protein [Candidatus Nomurabacteria bacterium]
MIDYIVNDESKVKEGVALCREVFNNQQGFEEHYDENEWREKLAEGGLFIAATENNTLIGFAMCYKKTPETFHIWDVGVEKEHRKKGVWRKMFNLINEYARKRGYSYLTIHTFKEISPVMFNFLVKEGFEITEDEFLEGKGLKTKFKNPLI